MLCRSHLSHLGMRLCAFAAEDPADRVAPNNQEIQSICMNIYVGNLPYSVRDEELRATFEAYGEVAAAEVIFDKRTRRSRGYGFVEMRDDGAAARAIAALNGKEFHGRELRVDASQPRTDKPAGRPAQERGPRPSGTVPAGTEQTPAGGGIKGFLKRLFG